MPAWISLAELPSLIRDGDSVAIGGMTLYRRPVALVRELLRAGRSGLEWITLTGGFETDLALGAGAIAKLRSCYVGFESFGLAPMFTLGAREGSFELVEETEVTLALGLRAALSKVDFLPHRAVLGTDVERARPDLKRVKSPYSDEEYLAVPALRPRVALLHALEADPEGNLWLGGNLGIDLELALLAEVVVVSVEARVEKLSQPLAEVAGGSVTHLIECPQGARPGSCWPHYPLAVTDLIEYLAAAGLGSFEAYLEEFLAPDLALGDLGQIAPKLGLEGLLDG